MSAYLCEFAGSRKVCLFVLGVIPAFKGLVCTNSTYELNSFKIPIAVLFATCPGVTSVQFMQSVRARRLVVHMFHTTVP